MRSAGRADVPLANIVAVLLDGCENLAMPGLAVGLLVRHLENAGRLLDRYLTNQTSGILSSHGSPMRTAGWVLPPRASSRLNAAGGPCARPACCLS